MRGGIWQVGTKRNHGILITMHGKNICDSLAVVINSGIQSAIKNELLIDAGTRALFLWLAINKQVAHQLELFLSMACQPTPS